MVDERRGVPGHVGIEVVAFVLMHQVFKRDAEDGSTGVSGLISEIEFVHDDETVFGIEDAEAVVDGIERLFQQRFIRLRFFPRFDLARLVACCATIAFEAAGPIEDRLAADDAVQAPPLLAEDGVTKIMHHLAGQEAFSECRPGTFLAVIFDPHDVP